MDPKELVKQHLSATNLMQLATAVDDKPWACTVHFYADDELNLYWMSKKAREHSQHISSNAKVAAAIMVHENTPEEKYVIGISVQGEAAILTPPVPENISQGYMSKFAMDPKWLAQATKRDGTEAFYVLKPSRIVLFDTKNLTGNPRQEISL